MNKENVLQFTTEGNSQKNELKAVGHLYKCRLTVLNAYSVHYLLFYIVCDLLKGNDIT